MFWVILVHGPTTLQIEGLWIQAMVNREGKNNIWISTGSENVKIWVNLAFKNLAEIVEVISVWNLWRLLGSVGVEDIVQIWKCCCLRSLSQALIYTTRKSGEMKQALQGSLSHSTRLWGSEHLKYLSQSVPVLQLVLIDFLHSQALTSQQDWREGLCWLLRKSSSLLSPKTPVRFSSWAIRELIISAVLPAALLRHQEFLAQGWSFSPRTGSWDWANIVPGLWGSLHFKSFRALKPILHTAALNLCKKMK